MNSVTDSETKQHKCDICKDTGIVHSKMFGGCKMWCGCGIVKLEWRADDLTGKSTHVRVDK